MRNNNNNDPKDDEINSIQKSLANLRKDMRIIVREELRNYFSDKQLRKRYF